MVICRYERKSRLPQSGNMERLAQALCMPVRYLTGRGSRTNLGEQPCWTCAHICDYTCGWAWEGEPVEGWRERQRTVVDKGRRITLTEIDYCPAYAAEARSGDYGAD